MTSSTSLFIEFAIEKKVLQFGDFITKAGRNSPYFFNLGKFNDGKSLKLLGEFYANKIIDTKIEFDLIFGPAYKGIPIVSSASVALSNKDINAPYSFNRKEIKDHGEGGQIIGSPIKGKVLILDDVISAGTSISESYNLIKNSGAHIVGVIVAIDRQEKGEDSLSATQEIAIKYSIPVFSIITLEDIVNYLESVNGFNNELELIKNFQKTYGVI
ncbi:orotate phosphoribosyltransferase [Nitrosomonadales bacterium]|nr:orotate phosphoribosyltransferase [Nitrosomonadales bacterium]